MSVTWGFIGARFSLKSVVFVKVMKVRKITIWRCAVLKNCNPPRSGISRVCFITGGWSKAAPRPPSEAKPYAPKAARLAIADHLQRKNIDGAVVPCPENREWHRVIYHLRSPLPLVSIIIPTRDQAALLQRCLTSIREKTDYAPIEIVIVDNGSTKPETHAFLHDLALDPRIQIVTDGAEFNFSRLINRGVRIARGEILAFLNDDIETDKSDWLREMVSRAIRPEVGRGRRALVVSRWKIAACRRGAWTPRSGASRIPTFSAATSRADESDLHLVTKLFRGYGCMHGATKNGLR